MKWIISFFMKSVLGFAAFNSSDKWYMQVIGGALAVSAVFDLVSLVKMATSI